MTVMISNGVLTNATVKGAKARDKTFKLFDGRGLHIEITPSSSKRWRFKYRFNNKENQLSLGLWPDTSLKLARERREEFRRLLANGINPSDQRKAKKVTPKRENSFESIAREWLDKYSPNWAPEYKGQILGRLENDVFPKIGDIPIADIEPCQLLEVLRCIEDRGALDTAHRCLRNCSQIFRYAVATGRIKTDPSRDLTGALPPTKKAHFAAITEHTEIGRLLRRLDSYQGTQIVSRALKLAPLLFVRPGELRKAEWADIDLDAAEWKFTVTKTNVSHIVPLSTQAVGLFAGLKAVTGAGKYVFRGSRNKNKPMSNNAALSALRRLGIPKEDMCGHGFRAMARTILDEVLNFRPDIIEHQLAHAVKDPNGRAYNRTKFLDERKIMMQKWADYLDEQKKEGVHEEN